MPQETPLGPPLLNFYLPPSLCFHKGLFLTARQNVSLYCSEMGQAERVTSIMESAAIQSTEEEADSVNIGTCPRPTVRGGRKGIQTPAAAAAEASQQFCFGLEIRSPGARYLYSFSYGVRSWPGTGAAKGREGRLPPEPDQRRGNCAPASPKAVKTNNFSLPPPHANCWAPGQAQLHFLPTRLQATFLPLSLQVPLGPGLFPLQEPLYPHCTPASGRRK